MAERFPDDCEKQREVKRQCREQLSNSLSLVSRSYPFQNLEKKCIAHRSGKQMKQTPLGAGVKLHQDFCRNFIATCQDCGEPISVPSRWESKSEEQHCVIEVTVMFLCVFVALSAVPATFPHCDKIKACIPTNRCVYEDRNKHHLTCMESVSVQQEPK